MKVICKVGDIVDEHVDVLVSTGNVQLNMSGGVNGEILLRGGQTVQDELHQYLRDHGVRHVEPGAVLEVSPGPTRARCLFYAAAIDAFYDSSVELVHRTISKALSMAADRGARTVALPALATGYGHLKFEEFAAALKLAIEQEYPGIAELRVVLRHEGDAEIVNRELKT
ncbi:MAG: macro domain-containing protein [Phycisphaerae bacterium]|jgi:O-acetyl-ADP-ribose deacetylase (regulator of RNase III)|nr:macro domain-containing protein [Phycisphaerae bacterium]MDP7290497.1 macro domain-containing protein [Phycisphaerae bacterium]